ncbi:MAG: Flp family type IVb pilin [Chloroflexi bacterium]|nr:Flp family type IVb pilin [Chloroflexota bacterium]
MNLMRRLVQEEEGAALVEYGLLVALIALVAIGAITVTGTQVDAVFQGIAANLVVP